MSTGCTPDDPCPNGCEPYSHEPDCCPKVGLYGRQVCPVKVAVPACKPDFKSGCANACDCVPCFNETTSAMTPEVKQQVLDMLTALMQGISPVERCGCDILDPIGHRIPLKPAQKTDPATGMFVFLMTNADGSTVETTSAINASTGEANKPVFDDLCCTGSMSKHSAFINNGMASNQFRGGNHPGFMGGLVGGVDSREFHERISEIFCCAIDKVNEAPILVITP